MNIMKDFDIALISLHNRMDDYRCDLISLLDEIEELNYKPIPKYTRLLYLNYISLSELSYSIKEYFFFKNIILL